MSRSVKKTPIVGNCGGSEKYDKRIANRRLRRAVKTWVRRPDGVIPGLRDVSNPWSMAKDGKHWVGHIKEHAKWLRK
jgi:hypothetical protein